MVLHWSHFSLNPISCMWRGFPTSVKSAVEILYDKLGIPQLISCFTCRLLHMCRISNFIELNTFMDVPLRWACLPNHFIPVTVEDYIANMDSQVSCYLDRSMGKYLTSLLCLRILLHRLHNDILLLLCCILGSWWWGFGLFKRYSSSSCAKPSALVWVCDDINRG